MQWPGSWRRVQELVEAHYSALYRYAYRLSGSAADAEDLTQDAFCKAQMQLHQLRDPDRAKPWLFTILRNSFLHRTRHENAKRHCALDSVGDIAGQKPEPAPDIDSDDLQNALNELPETFRTPVILYYFEEFSYRDIADQLDVPIGTVMSRLSRAKAHLRDKLQHPNSPMRGVAHGV